jgi:Protein of unknown function (DUF551)
MSHDLETICPHGLDPRTATCCRCADPAFDAAQQPIPSNQAGTVSLAGTGLPAPAPGGSLPNSPGASWISIEDHVPPYETEVLTTDGTYCNVAERTCTTKNGEVFKLAGQSEADGEREGVPVTHWMELPPLPVKETT